MKLIVKIFPSASIQSKFVSYFYSTKTNEMKKIVTILIGIFCLISSQISAQQMNKPSFLEIAQLPLWAQTMYENNPNVFEVDELYRNYYSSNLFEKSYHTQYYKRWRKSVNNRIDENGFPIVYSDYELKAIRENYIAKQSHEKSSDWSSVGPYHTQQDLGGIGKRQTNVYSIDQCLGNTNIMYLGTEPGEVYKSLDAGINWSTVSMTMDFGSGVTAIEVHPTNGDIVFAGGNYGIFRSTDGGSSWTNVLPQTNLNVNEILINPANDQIILAATDKGLYRSVNGGTTFTQLYTQKAYDVKLNTGNNNIVYMLKNNPALIICEFYSSSDMGETWNIQSTGWYSSTDAARTDGGGRIAVSNDDPNRVYAYLIGEAKLNDYGFIGVFKSNDAGTSWSLPNTPTGGPYNASHLNLAYGGPTWTYHQGFYNCAIVASPTNADEIIVGGLNLYKSLDGGSTFTALGGYVGGPLDMHVDNQDFRSINGNTWITTDGGVYLSTDFYTTQPTFKMDGVHGSDYWGFGSGWNEDVLVGGLYHNGNIAYNESYGAGNFLSLGGGEAPTGYVNPGNNHKTYFSDIGGYVIPVNITDPLVYFSMGMSPNESYYASESSEMEFHPNCYNIAYLGKDNKLWKTSDGGGSYNLVHTFGSSANDVVNYIEISSSNPDVIYLNQRPSSGSTGLLWKTTNGGVLWNQLTIPAGNSRIMQLTINPLNENEIWIAYTSGSNGNKVYHSINGGSSWTNITTTILNNESIQSLIHIAGTNGGIYAGTGRGVFYANNTSPWVIDNSGLPTYISTTSLRPFYRDGKVRMASYGKGIWESNLNEQPALPICRITVDKLEQTVFCELDSFYFEDYSFLNHTNASWDWVFPTGSPANSSSRNPSVLFSNPGVHLAVLTITDQFGNTDQDSLYVTVTNYLAPTFVDEDFESTFLPNGWFLTNPDNGGQWSLNSSYGGYGNSSQSAIFDNYGIDSQGSYDDMNIALNTLAMSDLQLSFDVAYAPYGGQYSDTLDVMVSTDCGATFSQVYSKGGTTLATAPTIGSNFYPTATEWRTESIDLSSYVNFDKVIIAFRNWGHFGNNIYIDNINILNDLKIDESNTNNFEMYPNPISSGCILHLKGIENGSNIKIFDNQGKVVFKSSSITDEKITLPNQLNSGVYWINVETVKTIWNKKIVVN